jgi:hypothetical protein
MTAAAALPLVASAGVAVGQPAAPSSAESFEVTGLVASPRRFTRDDLTAMPTWTMPVVFAAGQSVQTATFSGPPLLDRFQVNRLTRIEIRDVGSIVHDQRPRHLARIQQPH